MKKMKKILSLFAVVCLLLNMTIHASADVTGMDISYEKKNNQLVATVTADGTLGGAVVEIEFDADELSCTTSSVSISTSDDYVTYEYSVAEGVVRLGFVAIDPEKVPNGKIATITFDIATEVQYKTANQFDIDFNEEDIVTLAELKELVGYVEKDDSGSGEGDNDSSTDNSGSNDNAGSTDKPDDSTTEEVEQVVQEVVNVGEGSVTITVEKTTDDKNGATLTDAATAVESILTEEQMKLVEEGAEVQIILDVKNNDEKVSAEDKQKVEAEVAAKAEEIPNLTVGTYLDINLLVSIGSEEAGKVTQTNQPIKITINVPEELKALGEKFFIVRVHEGVTTILEDLDSDPNTITFETDKFSTYAIAYQTAEDDTTGDVEDETTGDVEDDKNDNVPEEPTVEKKNSAVVFIVIGAVVVVAGAAVAFWFISKKR